MDEWNGWFLTFFVFLSNNCCYCLLLPISLTRGVPGGKKKKRGKKKKKAEHWKQSTSVKKVIQ